MATYHNRQLRVSEGADLMNSIPIVAMAGVSDIRQRKTRASVLSALELVPTEFHAIICAFAISRPNLFERFQIRALISAVDLNEVARLLGPNAVGAALRAYERRRGESYGGDISLSRAA